MIEPLSRGPWWVAGAFRSLHESPGACPDPAWSAPGGSWPGQYAARPLSSECAGRAGQISVTAETVLRACCRPGSPRVYGKSPDSRFPGTVRPW